MQSAAIRPSASCIHKAPPCYRGPLTGDIEAYEPICDPRPRALSSNVCSITVASAAGLG
jgi:hypothetical protein